MTISNLFTLDVTQIVYYKEVMTNLNTTDDVIDALGGTSAVGRLLGRKPQAVHNWRGKMRAKFPPETYLVLLSALKAKKLSAPAALWGMAVPSKRSA